MKHKLVTVGALGLVLFISVCVVLTACSGLTGWLLSGQPVEQRITRIFPVMSRLDVEVTPPLPEPVVPDSDDGDSQAAVPLQAKETGASPPAAPNDAVVVEAVSLPEASAAEPDALENVAVAPQGGARLVIPKLNLDTAVVHSPLENASWKVSHLTDNVGHLEGTAAPGSDGNVVLAGHVTLDSGADGPFIGLSQLAPDDILYVYQDGQRFQYIVTDIQTVGRKAVEVTYPTTVGQLTLITCSNWDKQENRYLGRLVVKGQLVRG